jgi:hypothetical protein
LGREYNLSFLAHSVTAVELDFISGYILTHSDDGMNCITLLT